MRSWRNRQTRSVEGAVAPRPWGFEPLRAHPSRAGGPAPCGRSSPARTPARQAGGSRFESGRPHHPRVAQRTERQPTKLGRVHVRVVPWGPSARSSAGQSAGFRGRVSLVRVQPCGPAAGSSGSEHGPDTPGVGGSSPPLRTVVVVAQQAEHRAVAPGARVQAPPTTPGG